MMYGKIPLSFEANRGQAADGVKFLSHGQGYALFLTATDAVLALGKASDRGVMTTHLVGADPAPSVVGLEGLPGQVNHFLGNDPWSRRTDIPTYSRVAYRDVYPSTDLVYYGSAGGLEYDFVLQPLVVDPSLTYSTSLGGSGDDQGNGIAADGAGNLYVAGYTQTTHFPTKNAFQATFGGGEYDAFVTKIGL